MVQINPEDAWVYKRGQLAPLGPSITDVDAGRTLGPSTDDQFFAHLESLIAEDAHT